MTTDTKPSLTFITNIPSPYNLDLFESLSFYFDLNVFYYEKIESDRQWNIDIESQKYYSKVFEADYFSRIIKRVNNQLYFNFECIKLAFKTKDTFFILSGNYFVPNSILLLLILRCRGKKIFWYGESLLPTISKFKRVLKKILITPVNLLTNGIFAIGETAKSSYKNYGYKKSIINTPYSINNHRFTDVNEKQKTNNLSTINKKIIILSSGSLIYRKGFDVAIEAINLLDKKLRQKIEYCILGDGDLKNELQKLAKPDLKINFIGFVEPNNLPYYYKNSDIFLFTSRYDGWGVVINESMAAGLPIIVTKNCGASEYIDNFGGFVVECDPTVISKKLETLILNQLTRKKMGLYNFEKSKNISSDIIAKKMYDHLICNN
jgi:glycosyltransferase involved in cell wall biosynthesis